ncbi:MAG: radical SAM protein [Deltaproteobacteria bacterium]|nr:radical SAM protein [Deltaproteobacteria bacterium]
MSLHGAQNAVEPPFLISWNVTRRCPLKCRHCYLDSTDINGAKDIPTEAASKIIGTLKNFSPGAMLILTGGEPLLRPDINTLVKECAEAGFHTVIGTTGVGLTCEAAAALKNNGLKGAGLSIDSLDVKKNDAFRGLEGAYDAAIKAADIFKQTNIPFQFQFSVTRANMHEIEDFACFAIDKGAVALNYFFLVCTGRGEDFTDLSMAEYEAALERIAVIERKHSGKLMIRARCAPHFARISGKTDTTGCIAARGYMRISPEGHVTPCPYMQPEDTAAANIFDKPVEQIYSSALFKKLRSPAYTGKCGDCSLAPDCGGCRARALTKTGDIMADDEFCSYVPVNSPQRPIASQKPIWTTEAEERLKNIPSFIRRFVKKGIEKYAEKNSITTITPELITELKEKRAGGRFGI